MCLFLSKITKKKFLGPLSRKPAIQKISSIVVNYSTRTFLSSRSIPGYNLRGIWSVRSPFSAFGAFPTPLSFYHSEICPFLVIIFACAASFSRNLRTLSAAARSLSSSSIFLTSSWIAILPAFVSSSPLRRCHAVSPAPDWDFRLVRFFTFLFVRPLTLRLVRLLTFCILPLRTLRLVLLLTSRFLPLLTLRFDFLEDLFRLDILTLPGIFL